MNSYGEERNQEATVYVGNIDERATEPLLWELFLQAGPVVNVNLPKDRVTQAHQGYGFVEFMSEEDADYCLKILNMVKLYGKPLRINKATVEKEAQVIDVGASLFIGNLDPMISRGTGSDSKNYGFISYDNFEASDAALEAMHERLLASQAVKTGATLTQHKNFTELAQASGLTMAPLPAMPAPLPMMAPPQFMPGMMPMYMAPGVIPQWHPQ
ncbi:hypothetical protein HDV02_000656 [Globomyces sp. JEL0801]|nr:hypothetical protein HDV02_000656 [Globomyces sp. JEL0801]